MPLAPPLTALPFPRCCRIRDPVWFAFPSQFFSCQVLPYYPHGVLRLLSCLKSRTLSQEDEVSEVFISQHKLGDAACTRHQKWIQIFQFVCLFFKVSKYSKVPQQSTAALPLGCFELKSVYDWYLNFWCLVMVSSPPSHPTGASRNQLPLLVHISSLFEDPLMWILAHAPPHKSTFDIKKRIKAIIMPLNSIM